MRQNEHGSSSDPSLPEEESGHSREISEVQASFLLSHLERERAFTGGGLKDSPRRHDQASLISGPVGAVSDHQYDQPPSLLSHNNRRNKKTCISRTSSVLYFCLPHLFFCFGGPHYVVLLRSKDESVSGIVVRCIPTRCSLTMNGGRMKAVLEHCDALQTAGRESLLYGGNTEQNWEGHCAC